jgi:hypothetical protein
MRVREAKGLTAIALLGVAAFMTLAVGCAAEDNPGGSAPREDESTSGGPAQDGEAYDGVPAAALKERPWEVVSNKGETYLANVFYAESSQNEQLMPWTIDGRTMIDRMIYPTLGNPNLYVKGDDQDELVIVLRIEPDAFDHLKPARAPEGGESPLKKVTFTEDDESGFSFLLVARSQRAAAESSVTQLPQAGVVKIKPTKVLENPEPADMPAAFKTRKTLRFVFDKAAMANVPAGLYDARFEVRKNGAIFANVYEYQYNSVRVFDTMREEYTTLNVSDTQVSTGAEYKTLTADKFDDFVDGVNAERDPSVTNSAFITFNGDLHNGGSPGTVRQRAVAKTYMDEAKRIVGALKRLNYPIFLTTGNHDGYAAIGQVPGLIKSFDSGLGDSLEKVISEQNNIPWPDYSWATYSAFLDKTKGTPGGLPRDIFEGSYERRIGETFSAAFKEVPRSDRNIILYDGFYQWQKSYGPLYASWVFGKNRYVSMNSFEIRQHRRTGWGMYTVNYGGGVSKPQLEWLDRELTRGKNAGEDMVVLMHHDPRGGHEGKDLGYYSPMLDYRDMAQSTINYLLSEELVPVICKQPDWSLSVEERESCLHDGLQEWMAPDPELDKDGPGFFLSGVELLKRFVKSEHARTLILGHVHWNSLEVLQSGDVLVPNRLSLDAAAQKENASIEAANPVRRVSWEDTLMPGAPAPWRLAVASVPRMGAVETSLDVRSFDSWRAQLDTMLAKSIPQGLNTLSSPMGGPRELAILRVTSGADLTTQTYGGTAMYGYAAMHVTKQADAARVNRLTYFVHSGVDTFRKVATIDIDRTKKVAVRGAENPVDRLFDW